MTETLTLTPPPRAPKGSGANKIAQIRALEAQLASSPNNPGLHAKLAWAYVDINRWDDAIENFEKCYTLNTQQGNSLYAAKAAGAMGYCFFKRSWTAKNSDPNKEKDWRKGLKWTFVASKLYRKLRKENPNDTENKKNLALNWYSIGRAHLKKAEQSAKNPDQAQKYWLRGMKWKKKAYTLFERLSQTDPSTLENCAKTAGSIGQEYLDAIKRLQKTNPEQANEYWLKGMAWKEKAYNFCEELSHTDPSKKQNCALTAVQIAREFAEQGMDYYAIGWYEKALEHDPECTHIKKNDQDYYETLILAEQLEIVQTLGPRTQL